jgi:hypothetical protein
MAQRKKLYIVESSDTGNLGVFTSHKRAVLSAIRYAGLNEDGEQPTVFVTKYTTTVSGRNYVTISNELSLNVDF